MTQLDEAKRLSRLLSREQKPLNRNDAYFEGEQPLRFISPILERELGFRLSPLIINLARYSVDVYENRLDIEGFRVGDEESADEDLRDVWEANDGAFISQQAHRESLALGRAYALVSPSGGSGVPQITTESAFEAIHEDDPRTHQTKHGIKKWVDPDKTRWMTYLHTEGWITWYWKSGEWQEDKSESNDHKACALVPLPNDPRSLGRYRPGKFDQRLGRSVFHDVIPIMDATNKIAYDMMTSAEFHGLPRRWATGLSEDDFVDEKTGEALDTFSMIAGRLWGVENKDAKFGQFPEADLKNFHDTIKLLVQMAGQLLALPPHYTNFGASDTQASADAIRSAESQLVKRAERKQQTLSTKWERVQRLVLLTMGRADDIELKRIETLWSDPATPTVAQKADAIVKLVQAKDGQGRSILPIEQAREDLGYSQQAQDRMRDWDANSMADPQLTQAWEALENASRVREPAI